MKLTGLHIRGDLYYYLLIGLRAHSSVPVKPCLRRNSPGTHPEILVKTGWDVVWSVPKYFIWAAGRMADAFVDEGKDRLR